MAKSLSNFDSERNKIQDKPSWSIISMEMRGADIISGHPQFLSPIQLEKSREGSIVQLRIRHMIADVLKMATCPSLYKGRHSRCHHTASDPAWLVRCLSRLP